MNTIVCIPGSWDLLHVGHLKVLQRARALGDTLVVGVQSDEHIKLLKGKSPIISCYQRIEMLEGLECVDIAVRYEYEFLPLVKQFSVDIFCIGSDYCDDDSSRLRSVKEYFNDQGHGKVIVLPRTDIISTTDIKEKIKESSNV